MGQAGAEEGGGESLSVSALGGVALVELGEPVWFSPAKLPPLGCLDLIKTGSEFCSLCPFQICSCHSKARKSMFCKRRR